MTVAADLGVFAKKGTLTPTMANDDFSANDFTKTYNKISTPKVSYAGRGF